jgi:hypothetical protein
MSYNGSSPVISAYPEGMPYLLLSLSMRRTGVNASACLGLQSRMILVNYFFFYRAVSVTFKVVAFCCVGEKQVPHLAHIKVPHGYS